MSVTAKDLVKSPEKIYRISKARRTLCKGGCGRRVWSDYCRKCYRQLGRNRRK
jgi:hypothetical protein